MPHISELKDSRFLKKEDCGTGIVVTIKSCYEQNVANEGKAQELKWCLNFHEDLKPMILNSTNAQIIAAITGCEDTDGWVNQRIVLYSDPTVSYAGKLTGGIRARAWTPPPGQRPAPQPRHGPPPRQAPPARPAPRPAAPPPPDWQNAQQYGDEQYPENPDADVPY